MEKIGNDAIISSRVWLVDAKSFPVIIDIGLSFVQSTRSRVCFSRSPDMAPAVSAGTINIININCIIARPVYAPMET
jgi:hypothetical protein